MAAAGPGWPPRQRACALLLLAASLLPLDAYSGVYFMSPGKWREGKISWRYNPAGLPPGTDEAAILETVKRAFDAWSAVCNITAEYAGPTTTSLDATSVNSQVVLGYTALPYPQAADAVPESEDYGSSYTYFTSGKIRISNSIGANIQYNPNTLVHEIGHLLGLDHSDDPYSIMYANPYNAMPAVASYQLFGDDVTTCANLYGGKGLQVEPDYRNFLPDAAKGVTAGVETKLPSALAASASTGPIDLARGDTPWLVTRWNNASAARIGVRLIAPNGAIHSQFDSLIQGANGYLSFPVYLGLSGAWALQAFADQQPAAQFGFSTVNGYAAVPVKLEIAAIVEQDGTGTNAWRLFNYSDSAVGIDYSNAYLNGDYTRNLKNFSPAAGDNNLEVWVKSTLPRYPTDLAHNIGGQTAKSHDLVRRVEFAASGAGTLSGNRIDTTESGTLAAYSARGNIQTAAAGAQQIYVAAILGDAAYFRTARGWSGTVGSLFTLAAPGAANFDILRDFDTRVLPSGTALYIGYGASVDEMLAKQQFKLLRVF